MVRGGGEIRKRKGEEGREREERKRAEEKDGERKKGRKKNVREGPKDGGKEIRREKEKEERDTRWSHGQYCFTEHGFSHFIIINNKLVGSIHL